MVKRSSSSAASSSTAGSLLVGGFFCAVAAAGAGVGEVAGLGPFAADSFFCCATGSGGLGMTKDHAIQTPNISTMARSSRCSSVNPKKPGLLLG